MPNVKDFYYDSSDKKNKIHAKIWEPDDTTEILGILQIAHGMQEYIERYNDFALFLAEKGYIVAANDHLGHGGSVGQGGQFGYFADKDGNQCLIRDMYKLQKLVKDEYPEVPYVLLGHSMGSFLARQYLCQYGEGLDGAIISGTACHTKAEADLGMTLCRVIAAFKGWHYCSKMVAGIAMGGYLKRIKNPRTVYDWLTRDEKIVDEYAANDASGFDFTLNGYYNMFAGLKYLTVRRHLEKIPRDLPVLLIAGEEDPVGAYGSGPRKVAEELKAIGIMDVEIILYPDDRHEVLNELDRNKVWNDVLGWLKKKGDL